MEAKVLTPLQAKVLVILFDNGIGERGYYFTGGSALAEFYLQHRYSDDLDLFTRSAQSIRSDYADFRPLLASRGLEIVACHPRQGTFRTKGLRGPLFHLTGIYFYPGLFAAKG
ncbi:MAG: nucleotidyl transferase AbiEii/AbiGii toxin family protein [Deltaproteobacteria bacterium]|nr:nucleotidyl transferase AbiEii/AbiGii toxin family protein [Deltaproteobacteria bacterium]